MNWRYTDPATTSRAASPVERLVHDAPPELYFLISAVFHYLGPSFAVLLFARVQVLGVAWLRIASAAIILAVWRRPWRSFAALDRDARRLLIGWGGVLAVMNACFYTAISHLPLGTVAAIEFLPVIALAALGARSQRNLLALALAVGGVYALTDVHLAAEPLGLALAFANAVLFALYLVLADRVAKRPRVSGIDGLAAAMLIALVVITPIGGWQAAPALLQPTAVLAGIGVGISSSVIPYVTDQLAMTRLARATYALMVALLPALATVIGIIVLAQIPSWTEVTGVALVIAGVALHRRPSSAAEDASTLTPQQLGTDTSANGQTPDIERPAAPINQPYNDPGAHAAIQCRRP
jgi:inner membrane transporter RhtA